MVQIKRLAALLLLPFVLVSLNSCAYPGGGRTGSDVPGSAAGEPPAITIEDLQLGDLSVGSTDVRMLALLGEPVRKFNKSGPTEPGGEEGAFLYREIWAYPGVQVTFLNVSNAGTPPPDIGRVWAITVSTTGYATPRGIQVGDPLQKVLKAYGTKCTVREEPGIKVLEYGEVLYITMTIRNGIVKSITTEQLYD